VSGYPERESHLLAWNIVENLLPSGICNRLVVCTNQSSITNNLIDFLNRGYIPYTSLDNQRGPIGTFDIRWFHISDIRTGVFKFQVLQSTLHFEDNCDNGTVAVLSKQSEPVHENLSTADANAISLTKLFTLRGFIFRTELDPHENALIYQTGNGGWVIIRPSEEIDTPITPPDDWEVVVAVRVETPSLAEVPLAISEIPVASRSKLLAQIQALAQLVLGREIVAQLQTAARAVSKWARQERNNEIPLRASPRHSPSSIKVLGAATPFYLLNRRGALSPGNLLDFEGNIPECNIRPLNVDLLYL